MSYNHKKHKQEKTGKKHTDNKKKETKEKRERKKEEKTERLERKKGGDGDVRMSDRNEVMETKLKLPTKLIQTKVLVWRQRWYFQRIS